MTTTSRGLQPPYSYPAQASTSAAPIPSNTHARTRLDPPPPFLPPLPSTFSSAYPPYTPSQRPRERGESTPVHSRHREPSFPGTEALSTGAGAGRRKSSSTTPRRTLEGREETREERRVRKERERARREPGFEEVSPNSRRQRRTSSPTLGEPLFASTSTSSLRPTPSSPTSSKSVLTIALQRAQSAVLLDSANNVPAAIAAYTQSVRLLKEVMARVEEGGRKEEEVKEGETAEGTARREARKVRKDRAKKDEQRRLKVIHDTYEDRIRMLSLMGSPEAPDASDTPASPTTPTNLVRSPGFQTTSTSPFTLRDPTPTIQVEFDLSSSEGVGSAMLLNLASPPASPMDPMLPAARAMDSGREAENEEKTPRVEQWSEDDGDESPVEGRGRGVERPSRARQMRAPEMRRRPSLVDETIVEEGLGIHNEEDLQLLPDTANAAVLTTSPSFRSQSLAAVRTAPLIAIEPGSPLDQFPSDPLRRPSTPPESSAMAFSYSDPGERRMSIAGGGYSSAYPSDKAAAMADDRRGSVARDRAESNASSSMQRTTSGKSLAFSRGGSSFGEGSSYGGLSMTSSLSEREDGGRTRGSRSASLATASAFAPGMMASRSAQTAVYSERGESAGRMLISSTTTLGTISHRRSGGPQSFIDGSSTEYLASSSDADPNPFLIVRPSSAEPNDFGYHPRSAGSNAYSSASLPLRLRTLSQPGKRPFFPTIDEPPVPSLSTARPPTGPNFAHKSFSPSLSIAPLSSLRRTNSTSSQTSFFDHAPRPTSSGERAETPVSAMFGRLPPPPPSAAGGTYLSQPPPPSPLQPIPTLHRPFHLMQQILLSIEQGGYVTPRLYIPKQVWSQAGVKLVAVETKVRMLDLLSTGLEGVEGRGRELERGRGEGMVRELEAFEGLMEGIQSTLAKKLGYGTSGKKMGATSFSAWSSKLSRSLDRVTNGRSLDSPALYVEGIAKVFKQARIIDQHLTYLANNERGYASLSKSDRQRISDRLRRSSEFFRQVICQFVLRDLGILLDKYVKRAGTWAGGE